MSAGKGLLLTNWRVGGVILFDIMFSSLTHKQPQHEERHVATTSNVTFRSGGGPLERTQCALGGSRAPPGPPYRPLLSVRC